MGPESAAKLTDLSGWQLSGSGIFEGARRMTENSQDRNTAEGGGATRVSMIGKKLYMDNARRSEKTGIDPQFYLPQKAQRIVVGSRNQYSGKRLQFIDTFLTMDGMVHAQDTES
jgi:hypothetical protein